MIHRNLLPLNRHSYYAPVPTLFVEPMGRIGDINIALRVLMETDIEGMHLRPVRQLADNLGNRVQVDSASAFFAPGGTPGEDMLRHPSDSDSHMDIKTNRLRYLSRNFGWASLRETTIPHPDPENGALQGTTIYWDVREMDRFGEFVEALDGAYRQQLDWESYAMSYDRVLPNFPFYQEVVERHCNAVDGPDIQNVLDIGAGTGNVTIKLLGVGRHVTAVDLSRAMLEKLRRKVAEPQRMRLTIVEQNAERLPQWDDDTFDAVTALLAFYDMTAPTRALNEAVRVLKPGGTMIVTEPKSTFCLDALLERAEQVLEDKGIRHTLRLDWDRVYCINKRRDPTKREDRIYIEQIEQHFRQMGFENICKKDSHYGNCATVKARKTIRS